MPLGAGRMRRLPQRLVSGRARAAPAPAPAPAPAASGEKRARPTDLPPGWTSEVRQATARDYKIYVGPNGEQAPSIPQAWRKYESSAGAEAAVQVYGKRKKAAPAAAPAAAEEGGDSSEADGPTMPPPPTTCPRASRRRRRSPALARTPAEVVAMLKPKAKAAEPDSSDEDA